MTEIQNTETAAQQIAARPLILDETPVDDGCNKMELWVREGDELATMRVTEIGSDEDADGNEIETETQIDTYLRADELTEIAIAAGKALAKIGTRAELIDVIKELTELLA